MVKVPNDSQKGMYEVTYHSTNNLSTQVEVYMKKKYFFGLAVFSLMLMLNACSNKALEEATAAVDSYNKTADTYNKAIEPYNEAVGTIEDANAELQKVLDAAQQAIDAGEQPFDEETLTALKEVMASGTSAKIGVPDLLQAYEVMEIAEDAKRADLEALTEEANTKLAEIEEAAIPEIPAAPDYSEVQKSIADATSVYQDSIQSLKQVTAPEDAFVMERLQGIETITAIDAVTEDHDPNNQLNKQGGYIGCVYFADTQVDRSKLYIEDGKDNVIDVGTIGGGAVEIFKTAQEAETRNAYLGGFDGTGFSSGSHHVIGTCIIRTSDNLTGTQQTELTEKITGALTRVVH